MGCNFILQVLAFRDNYPQRECILPLSAGVQCEDRFSGTATFDGTTRICTVIKTLQINGALNVGRAARGRKENGHPSAGSVY
jgi:hypothetical protein